MQDESFRDREDAGLALARDLTDYRNKNAVILAIPRGGVPVGYQIAQELHAPFDIIIPRKIPIPWNTEAGFGAITADGTMVLNEPLVSSLDLREDEIKEAADEVRLEIVRRMAMYRDDRAFPDLSDKPVILVDDGLASGYTMLAAIESVRKHSPSEVVVAVPVASSGAARLVTLKSDRLVALIVSHRLPFAVASFYRRWHDLTDDEVSGYLEQAWSAEYSI